MTCDVLQTLDNEEQYTEEELKEYEKMLMEEEERRRQQGSFDGHAQPGLVVGQRSNVSLHVMVMLSPDLW
jgi:hypothetical protein